MTIRWQAIVPLTLPLLTLLITLPAPDRMEGQVLAQGLPVDGARIRWRGTQFCTRSNNGGHFQLPIPPKSTGLLTAWKPGYRITASPRPPLILKPLPAIDNEDYEWVDAFPDRRRPNNCANCHQKIFEEWAASAHARSVANPSFLRYFAGSNGAALPSTTWNLLGEHPDGAGVCSSCHAPTFHDPDLTYDLRQARGVAARGVHCDYCHKIADAPTDKLGTRFGRDGYRLLRPAHNDQLFFGPLDDAVRAGESFAHAPLYQESRYCASCHEGVLFGVHVYGTYSEWLASPAFRQGKTCQRCHMAPTGRLSNIAPGHGGIERDPKTLASHSLPGATREMLKKCLQLTTRLLGGAVQVTLTADEVGHAVPTGFIDRHLVLAVEGLDQMDKPVTLLEGPRLPAAAGKMFQGKPGVLYAKVLIGEDGRTPLPFWIPPIEVKDNRLHPSQPDQRRFLFSDILAKARIRLIYRRLWPEVAPATETNEIILYDLLVLPQPGRE